MITKIVVELLDEVDPGVAKEDIQATLDKSDTVEIHDDVFVVNVHDSDDAESYVQNRLSDAGMDAVVWSWEDYHAE